MENYKSKIIPQLIKKNIDEILEQQLLNANRYYAEANSDISELIDQELYNTPDVFLQRLKDRWNWHNLYYEALLEPAFLDLVTDSDKELSPKEIDELINIHYTSCLVDEATLIMTGAIKKYLDYYCKFVFIEDENIDKEEGNHLLLTPPVETFFAQYQIDHLFYIYLSKNNSEKRYEFKSYLLKKYHANDLDIFISRFNKRFNSYLDSAITETFLLDEIKKYSISQEYKVKHFYFTIEHPDRQFIRDIIIYDNLTEKLNACNLIGISGFLLRQKILQYLNESQILPNNGYIYEYNKETIIEALKMLKKEREKTMEKNVRVYKQRGDTCAIACMMMVLEYYKKMQKANWYDEKRYYKLYGSKYMSGTPFSALAFHLSKNGLDVKLFHEDLTLFNNTQKALSNESFELAMAEYKIMLERAVLKGTKVINGNKIDANLLRKELEKGNLVILAGEISGFYHAILISGYNEESFIVCDPLHKTKQIKTAEDLEKFMNTSIGKWFISVSNNTKEKQELVNNIDDFNKEANNIVNRNHFRRKIDEK